MSERATIRDVAKAAGVSITTTSQILKGVGRYSDATIKHVWEVVNELHYTPNPYAKKFFAKDFSKHEKTGLLMRMTNRPYNMDFFLPDGYEPLRMFYFERACMEHDYSGTNYIYRHEQGVRNHLLLNDSVDGVILNLPHRSVIENISERFPVVLLDVDCEEDMGAPLINSDLAKEYSRVLQFIRESEVAGKMAVIGANVPASTVISWESQAAPMLKAAQKNGIEVEDRHRLAIDITPDTNEVVMEQIGDRVLEMVRNEGVRIVGIRYIGSPLELKKLLEKRGLCLPQDVLILGGADMPIHEPGIAGVAYDWEKMMETAVNVLLQRIDKPDSVCGKYLVPCLETSLDFLK